MTHLEYSPLLLPQLSREPPVPPALGVWLRSVLAGTWLLKSPPLAGKECSGFFPFLTPSATCFSKGVKALEEKGGF